MPINFSGIVDKAMTTSRRLADKKTAKFQKNITKRGSVPETTVKKGADYPVGPIVLGFFIFVVIGSLKRHRSDFAPKEAAVACDQAAKIATRLTGLMCSVVQVKKKKRLRKVGSRGPKMTVESAEIDIICIDEGFPEREEGADI
ncbi:uncharacterized protein A4U43_C03F26970 [Asparagus officinalis]|uniref:Stress-associated endoplasmic reticulum protein n=1 Tax=Asparagus officinalis TaxID=4686 RepID=A0A5P1FHJ8_ASPOF|nr:uncharacterized protein A4U43_C03F26970 [Asparagus officinalis]